MVLKNDKNTITKYLYFLTSLEYFGKKIGG